MLETPSIYQQVLLDSRSHKMHTRQLILLCLEYLMMSLRYNPEMHYYQYAADILRQYNAFQTTTMIKCYFTNTGNNLKNQLFQTCTLKKSPFLY